MLEFIIDNLLILLFGLFVIILLIIGIKAGLGRSSKDRRKRDGWWNESKGGPDPYDG